MKRTMVIFTLSFAGIILINGYFNVSGRIRDLVNNTDHQIVSSFKESHTYTTVSADTDKMSPSARKIPTTVSITMTPVFQRNTVSPAITPFLTPALPPTPTETVGADHVPAGLFRGFSIPTSPFMPLFTPGPDVPEILPPAEATVPGGYGTTPNREEQNNSHKNNYKTDGISINVDNLMMNKYYTYVTNWADHTISAFEIDSDTGAIMEISGSPFPAPYWPGAPKVHPSGKYLYITTDETILGFEIDPASGRLANVPGFPYWKQSHGGWQSIDPTGKYIYINQPNVEGTVAVYNVNIATGSLNEIPESPFDGESMMAGNVLHPAGKFFYVTNACWDNISGYTVDSDTGVLRKIEGSPFPSGESWSWCSLNAQCVVFEPTGKFLYVANYAAQTVAVFAVNSVSGALEEIPESPFTTGMDTDNIAIDPEGRYCYVTGAAYNTLLSFAIDSDTGVLTPAGSYTYGSSLGVYHCGVAIHPEGSFYYQAEGYGDIPIPGKVYVFRIDSSTGTLTEIPEFTVEVGERPGDICIATEQVLSEAKIQKLMDEIIELVDSGQCDSNLAYSMLDKLLDVLNKLGAQGNTKTACEMLQSFIKWVCEFTIPGLLSYEDGIKLKTDAMSSMMQFSCKNIRDCPDF